MSSYELVNSKFESSPIDKRNRNRNLLVVGEWSFNGLLDGNAQQAMVSYSTAVGEASRREGIATENFIPSVSS
jgi:hypothetical protein